jgi:hypothetical protein
VVEADIDVELHGGRTGRLGAGPQCRDQAKKKERGSFHVIPLSAASRIETDPDHRSGYHTRHAWGIPANRLSVKNS